MPASFTYLLVNIGCLLVPLVASFHPSIKFYRQWRNFLPASLVVASLFIAWDIFFVRIGVWSFNPNYVLGYYVAGLPLEEIVFFLCIPYACMFTFHCCSLFIKGAQPTKWATALSIVLSSFLFTIALINLPHLYTSVTFIALSILLTILTILRAPFISTFYISFGLILLPFVISNGILTGSWIDEPVVLYNNSQNLGVRILTIPVEDVFYGMLLLLLNTSGYYIMQRKPGRKIFLFFS